MENNNVEMKQLAHDLINDKKSSAKQNELSDQIAELITANTGN